jgi:hypothetical protein
VQTLSGYIEKPRGLVRFRTNTARKKYWIGHPDIRRRLTDDNTALTAHEFERTGRLAPDYTEILETRQPPLWIFPIAAALVVLAWQWATVTANFDGNWSALFCTGQLQRQPPALASEHTYVFAGSAGYDGQLYHYMAHDPLLRTDISTYLDTPRLRYRRILVPALAYALALGRTEWIDRVYRFVILLAMACGVYCACRYCRESGLPPAWGMLFLLFPALPITVDRMVVDGVVAVFTAAFLLWCRQPSWKLFLILCGAAWTRETGLLLPAGYCAWLIWRSQMRTAAVFALSAVPALAWYAYVAQRTPPGPYGGSMVPLSGIWRALLHPWPYPAGMPLMAWVQAADFLALMAVLLAFVMTIAQCLRRPAHPARILAALFVLMGIVVQRTDFWTNVYGFGRVYTPLLLCLAALAAETRRAVLLAPAALMLPRIAIQLVPQIQGMARWLLAK